MPKCETPQYEDYRKLIAFQARSFNRLYAVELDELMCEGNLIFVQACQKYNSARSSFSTFLYRCLQNRLQSFCTTQRRQMFFMYSADGEMPEAECRDDIRVKNAVFIRQSIAQLPAAGKRSMRLLMTTPAALGLDGSEGPKATRGALKRHILSQGETWAATWQTLREIRNIFQEVRA